jgi:hypothetical protein
MFKDRRVDKFIELGQSPCRCITTYYSMSLERCYPEHFQNTGTVNGIVPDIDERSYSALQLPKHFATEVALWNTGVNTCNRGSNL